ncbi:type 11 methyltransferase [Salinisphaera dokdonensis CL-ES53]|uniref:Type 11 methyltransferase n=1 Tax=Salinisphaera dokdonensis CL-ES53 TaxID=1304272 RepID=A0ABV2B5H6_9GAMM
MTACSRNAVAAEYARLAGGYDAKSSFYIKATTRETLARLFLRPQDRVLDIGCGTGALLQRLCAIHPPPQLCGVDPVFEMLAMARRELSSTVDLRQGWAERLPFADAQFDVVVSCSVFHYLYRPDKALTEILRVLRPGGQLVITDWSSDYLMCRLLDRYLQLTGRAHSRVYRAQEHVERVESAGFATVDVDQYKINWLWGLITARFARTRVKSI